MTAVPPVISSIAPEANEPTDVAFILRSLNEAYSASYPTDILTPAVTPTLVSLTPSSIVAGTPTRVDIVGTEFRHDTQVYVDGVAQITSYTDATHLWYLAQATAPPDQNVDVRTKGLVSNVLVLTVTASTELMADEGADVGVGERSPASPPAAPDADADAGAPDEPEPEDEPEPPTSPGGVPGGRKPRNGNGNRKH